MSARAVVVAGPEEPGPWSAALAGAPTLRPGDAGWADAIGAADLALVDGAAPDPVQLARRVHRADPAVQVALVTADHGRARLERALLFAPGLGEVWVVEPAEAGPALAGRAAGITRRRRRYRAARTRVAHDLASMEPHPARRALVSDAYLAALLDALPDPVLSVDDDGRVLSWSPAAERVFGRPRRDAVGRRLDALLDPGRPGALADVLARARAAVAEDEVRFRRADGEARVGELLAVPVEAAGHRVRAVVVRDVTEARETQGRLEEQAAELESINAELQERGAALEQALASRSRFYAAMSHELRTPINAVLGYNELLLEGIYGPLTPAQAESLGRAQRAARHLMELVNDVLDLAKVEAGRIELETEPAAFPKLLEELLDTVRSLARSHGSVLRLEPAEEVVVVTDPRRVRQVLLNLISNAVKYGEGGPVRIGCVRTPDGGVRVEVEDRGPGIAAEDVERVFEEFVQLAPHEAQGTGLGLPLSRRLAELLGGRLEVRSTPGRGSVFALVLPPRPGG